MERGGDRRGGPGTSRRGFAWRALAALGLAALRPEAAKARTVLGPGPVSDREAEYYRPLPDKGRTP